MSSFRQSGDQVGRQILAKTNRKLNGALLTLISFHLLRHERIESADPTNGVRAIRNGLPAEPAHQAAEPDPLVSTRRVLILLTAELT